MSEGTRITVSGLLLLAAALIGLYGMWLALFQVSVYGALLTSAFIASAIVPGRNPVLQAAILLALVLLVFLFGYVWYDRIWAPMTEADRIVTSLAIMAIAGLGVLVRLTRQLINRSIAHRAAKRIVIWPK